MLKKVFQKVNKNRNIIGLMGAYLMRNILYMFLNTFMVAYFITLTNYDYSKISIYYIFTYFFLSLTFFALGRIIKNINQIIVFRIGMILNSIYVILIAILKENIVNYYALLGVFYGIVQGFFWVSLHSLINEYVGNKTNKFVSIKSIFDNALKILVPIVLGVSIEFTSFTYVANIVIFISVIQILFSLLIKDESAVSEKKYDIKGFWLKYKNNELLKKCYKINSYSGIVNHLLDTIITIIIVMTFKTTISLGILTTLFSICSIISVFIYQTRIKNKKNFLSVATIALVFSVLLLILKMNKITIIIYNLFSGIFLIVLKNIAEAKRYTVTEKIKEIEKDFLIEYHVVSECHINIARIIGYGVLFIASLFNNLIVFNLLLIVIMIIIYKYYNLIVSVE
jgi:YQGE family putative transporter